MSYSHSFANGFYYDEDEAAPNKSKRPTSVHMALRSMKSKDWKAMCKDVFPGVEPDYVDIDMVMDKIMETDTVSNLDSPVEVWIDEEGYHTIEVYDKEE